jgi:putative aldouronate transport system substrate-binding protein
LGLTYGPPVAPRDQNQYWQELEKRLGVTLDVTLVPAESYSEKTAAVIASGAIPDLFYMNPGQNAAHLYQPLAQGAFTDLTPYLSGPALNEYPNLARFPEVTWKNVRVNGKIYGVPKPIQLNGIIPFVRGDWMKKVGKNMPKNADEVYDLLVSFSKNDPDGNGQPDTYGIASAGSWWDQELIDTMFRVPNNWRRNADGSLTHAIETDEYKQSVAFMRRLWEGGAYHPDSASMQWSDYVGGFTGGKLGLHNEVVGSFFGTGGVREKTKQQNSAAEVVGLVPPGHDGGQAVTYNTPGYFGFTGIPASVGRDQARVKELLSIMNYLAAPDFSEENIFVKYGIEGVHHTLQPDGTRSPTDKGKAEIGNLTSFAWPESQGFYYPGTPGDAEYAQDLAKQIVAVGIDDPTLNLYSPTAVSKGAELEQLGNDRLAAIIMGREPLESLDQYVSDWRSRGGDQIRQEYEQALKG